MGSRRAASVLSARVAATSTSPSSFASPALPRPPPMHPGPSSTSITNLKSNIACSTPRSDSRSVVLVADWTKSAYAPPHSFAVALTSAAIPSADMRCPPHRNASDEAACRHPSAYGDGKAGSRSDTSFLPSPPDSSPKPDSSSQSRGTSRLPRRSSWGSARESSTPTVLAKRSAHARKPRWATRANAASDSASLGSSSIFLLSDAF
mmetsp:Transcript_14184/g.56001  ORF Transcript_14184/g.56001 Transcript_14184/m.56001 type:complete len:206 (-) Transcript_14184:959-1576(-)